MRKFLRAPVFPFHVSTTNPSLKKDWVTSHPSKFIKSIKLQAVTNWELPLYVRNAFLVSLLFFLSVKKAMTYSPDKWHNWRERSKNCKNKLSSLSSNLCQFVNSPVLMSLLPLVNGPMIWLRVNAGQKSFRSFKECLSSILNARELSLKWSDVWI